MLHPICLESFFFLQCLQYFLTVEIMFAALSCCLPFAFHLFYFLTLIPYCFFFWNVACQGRHFQWCFLFPVTLNNRFVLLLLYLRLTLDINHNLHLLKFSTFHHVLLINSAHKTSIRLKINTIFWRHKHFHLRIRLNWWIVFAEWLTVITLVTTDDVGPGWKRKWTVSSPAGTN